MRLTRVLAVSAAALLALVAAEAPANAAWLTSSVPSDSSNAVLRVDDSPKVGPNGWQVTWKIRIKCPRNQRITGQLILVERDPAAIPELAGDDGGIRASRQIGSGAGLRCTGSLQTLAFSLKVSDTTFFDPALGDTRTVHEPMHPAPSTRTTASAQFHSVRSVADGGYFVQYCAAPNCAEESGPRVTFR